MNENYDDGDDDYDDNDNYDDDVEIFYVLRVGVMSQEQRVGKWTLNGWVGFHVVQSGFIWRLCFTWEDDEWPFFPLMALPIK